VTSGTVVAPMSTHCFLHGTLAGHNCTGRFYSIHTSYSSTVETENEVRLSSEKLVDRSGVGMGAGNVLPIYIFVTEKKKKKGASDHPALSIHVKTSFNFSSIVRRLVYARFCFFDKETESWVWFSLSEPSPRARLRVVTGRILYRVLLVASLLAKMLVSTYRRHKFSVVWSLKAGKSP